MESFVEEAWRRIDEVHSPGARWATLLNDGTSALLGVLAERPAFAHLALVDAAGAGGRAAALYASGRATLLAFIEQGRGQEIEEMGIPASTGRAALAGAEVLIATQILAGKADGLGELAADVVYLLTVPYLGQKEATRLAAGPAAPRHLRAVA
jgi:hypothetical protein